MKLYIWTRKDYKVHPLNIYPYSKVEPITENSFKPLACHAFFKKKDAINYMQNEIKWDKSTKQMFKLISVTTNES